jgi:hypothetical protein
MDIKVLVFADEPALGAQLLFDIEAAGPFSTAPIDIGAPGHAPKIPAGDVAILAVNGNTTNREALLAELAGCGIPVIFIGKPPEIHLSIGARTAFLRDLNDFSELAATILRVCASADIMTPPPNGGGPVPCAQDAVVDKS